MTCIFVSYAGFGIHFPFGIFECYKCPSLSQLLAFKPELDCLSVSDASCVLEV